MRWREYASFAANCTMLWRKADRESTKFGSGSRSPSSSDHSATQIASADSRAFTREVRIFLSSWNSRSKTRFRYVVNALRLSSCSKESCKYDGKEVKVSVPDWETLGLQSDS